MMLNEQGLNENERNLANKVGRGELSAAFLLVCLKAMGCETISLQTLKPLDGFRPTPWTVDSALQDDLVTVVDRDDKAGIFHILVGELTTPIAIGLERKAGTESTEFSVSHAIKTPEQKGPYRTNLQVGPTPGKALYKAITGLTTYYRMAVDAGHEPTEDWLIPYPKQGSYESLFKKPGH